MIFGIPERNLKRQFMKHTPVRRRTLRALIGCIALPLATIGCQHNHSATTQMALTSDATTQEAATQEAATQEAATQMPVTPVATTDMSVQPAPTPVANAEAPTTPGAAPTVTSGEGATTPPSGSTIAAAPGGAAHGMAQASRNTGHAIAGGSRELGSSAWDVATNSFVRVRNSPPLSLTAPVIDVDEAMQARDWDRSVARYKSGAVVAGPIGFLYQPRSGQNQWRYQIVDLPLFLGNTALLPFAFAQTPPWKPVEWKADTVEPTYTGVPPLPPE
jgi:hypothetical protein